MKIECYNNGNWRLYIKTKKNTSLIILSILFFSMIALLAVIIVLNFEFRDADDWNELLFSLMDELLSAIIISLFLGLITKIITDQLFSVEINMNKLSKNGIYSIGDGKLRKDDIKKMFGSNLPKKYHLKKIKLLFLTGNKFLDKFKDEIINCLNNDTEINLLIASPEKENEEYLKRCSARFVNGTVDYVKEIIEESLKTIHKIKMETTHPENFVVRFYRDEYQNNIRISKYSRETKEVMDEKWRDYYWINVQPISKVALDLSIALKGYMSHKEYKNKPKEPTKDDNICLASESGFDALWKTYKDTEYIIDKYYKMY